MSNTKNFLIAGKVGDFIHQLYAAKAICERDKVKAKLYMYGGGWDHGIKKTHGELKVILKQQEYVESLNILTRYTLDGPQTSIDNTPVIVKNKRILSEGYIDLGSWIRSDKLYNKCFSELYSNYFNFDMPKTYAWLKYNKVEKSLKNKILIHQRNHFPRINKLFPYADIIKACKGNAIFIATDQDDYEMFPYKDEMPFLQVSTLIEWVTAINSCKAIITNLSGPAAIAHALDKPRIIELSQTPDMAHCIGEERHSNNVFWYFNEYVNNLKYRFSDARTTFEGVTIDRNILIPGVDF